MKKQDWKLLGTSLLLATSLGLAPIGCGGGGGDGDGDGGGDGDGDGDGDSSGDGDGDGDGDTAGDGDGDMAGDGDGDVAGDGDGDVVGDGDGDVVGDGDGDGDMPPPAASIDELISAICEWEFGCCNEGELTYRLGVSVTSAAECTEYFTFQLRESNATGNPFPTGTATGLLGTLGYTVDLSRVTENADNIGACVAQYEGLDCPSVVEAQTFCSAPGFAEDDPCALSNLFDPALEVGDRCTLSLAQGGLNDVECPVGSTCLAAGDPDNPEDFPACVQRGTDGQPCNSDTDCDYNFYCDPAGDCIEKGGDGDPCTFNDSDAPMPGDEDASCQPGYKCHPIDEVCVSNCEVDYPCTVNSECPEGNVCAPIDVGDDGTSWKSCLPLGSGATDRCDEDADCAGSLFCDGNVCVTDYTIASNNTCARDAQCEAGSFCDLATLGSTGLARIPTETCVAYFAAQGNCYPRTAADTYATGCNPSGARHCLKNTATNWQCVSSLRAEDADCSNEIAGAESECRAGLSCETTDLAVTTCTAGAAEGDPCDDVTTDADELSCAAGLVCKEAECVAQLDPGEDCEDRDVAGTGDSTLCKNSACVENWDENGVSFICSDAPVPESNGGDGLTCGG